MTTQQHNPPTKIKNSDPPANTFIKFLPPSPQPSWRRGACHAIDYSKNTAKKRKQERINLEIKLKILESNLNSEENSGVHNRVRKLIVKDKEITDPKEISNNIKVFYETLFKQNSSKVTN